MIPVNPMNAREVEQQYHQLVAEGQYAAALQVATEHFSLFSHPAQKVVYFWRMDMACRLGESSLALDVFREAVEAGHWYAKLDENHNFQALHDWPEFQALVKTCAQRRLDEMAEAPAVMQVLQPQQRSASYPLLFALHGNGSNVEALAPRWQQATAHGWMVALPQSPQAQGAGLYSWNDWDWAIPTLVRRFGEVCEAYPIDRTKVALAGFSMGAGLALWLALERTLAVQGVIAVAPFLSDVDALRPVLSDEQNRSLHFYLVASHQDEYCYKVAGSLAALMAENRVEHRLDLYAEGGHAFPPSFELAVPAALEYVLNGDAA